METIVPSLFHLIPSELLEIIISYLRSYESFVNYKKSYYIIYKLSKDIKMWKRLIQSSRHIQILQDYFDTTKITKITLTSSHYAKLYYD